MSRLILASSLIALLFSSATFANTMQSLNQTQINDLLNKKTIETIPLVTMNGSLTKNTFTGYFGSHDKIEGQMANKPDNGPINDAGTWVVNKDGVMCVTWQHWNNTKPICVAVYKLKNSIIFVNVKTDKLETLVLKSDIKNGKHI